MRLEYRIPARGLIGYRTEFLTNTRSEDKAVELRTWTLRIAARRGKQVTVVALARRLAGILYARLRDGRIFEPQHVFGVRVLRRPPS